MKKVLLFISLILPFGLSAQEAPDNDQILRAIIDSNSPYYYPALMTRYQSGDLTLTQDDYYHLYYGFAYQAAYRPLEPVAGEDQLLMFLERIPEPDSLQASSLVKLAEKVMESDPFSPKNINFMTYAYGIMGDSVNEKVNAERLRNILAVIKSTGTGEKEKSPWHVLWYSHAADVVATEGWQIDKRTIRTRTVEYISLLREPDAPKGYFFDFGRMYWKRPENITRERRVQGFELNGIPLGRRRYQAPPR